MYDSGSVIVAVLHVVLHSWQQPFQAVKPLILTSEKLCSFGTCPRSTRDWLVWASNVFTPQGYDLLIAIDSDQSWHTQPRNGDTLRHIGRRRPWHCVLALEISRRWRWQRRKKQMPRCKDAAPPAMRDSTPPQSAASRRGVERSFVCVYCECRLEISVGFRRRPWNCYKVLMVLWCIVRI